MSWKDVERGSSTFIHLWVLSKSIWGDVSMHAAGFECAGNDGPEWLESEVPYSRGLNASFPATRLGMAGHLV